MNPMSTFDPDQPCRVHDALNNRFIDWNPDWANHYREDSDHHREDVIEWDGRLLDGWTKS